MKSILRWSVVLLLTMIINTAVQQTALAERPGTHWLTPGTAVEVDIIMAGSPSSSMWRTGKIVEVQQSMNSYIVEVEGSRRTIINNDQWIKPAANAAPVGNPPPPTNTPPAATAQGGTTGGITTTAGGFTTGDTVVVDRIMASTPGGAQWTTGKVVRVNPDRNSIDVQTPDGILRTIVNNSQWIKPGTTLPGPAAPPEVRAPRTAPATGNGKPEWDRKKGLGQPPDGVYTCHKLSGYVLGGGHDIDLGKLQIQGSSYRGLDPGGPSAPFTVNGEQIQWSRGLDGVPNGWEIKSSKYIGSDERGRPLIRVYYRAATRGALECIDCYRER